VTEVVRFGVVGTGAMARTMVRAMQRRADVRPVAVASGDETRARTFAAALGLASAGADVETLVARSDVDALYVASRNRDHARAVDAAIRSGKPVLVEKPLTPDLERTQALLAAAEGSGVLLVENLWTLLLPAYRALAEQARSGRLGDPVHFRFEFGYPLDPATARTLLDPRDGGVLLDRAIYGVAAAIWLCGPVEMVQAEVQRDRVGGVDLTAAIRLRHASGVRSETVASFSALLSNSARLSCTRGAATLDAPVLPGEWLRTEFHHDGSGGSAGAPSFLKERLRSMPVVRRLRRALSGPRSRFCSFGPDPYGPILEHFSGLVRRGARQSEVLPPALSRSVHEVLARAAGRPAQGS
jgi:predicted dehydrogenase